MTDLSFEELNAVDGGFWGELALGLTLLLLPAGAHGFQMAFNS